jgi:hypothetical protein
MLLYVVPSIGEYLLVERVGYDELDELPRPVFTGGVRAVADPFAGADPG